MKKLLTVLFCLSLPLIGADKKPLTKEESAKIIETAIRKAAKKLTGELTKADYEKVRGLFLRFNQLTEAPKGLEKLPQLKQLHLEHNQLTDVTGLEKFTQLTFLNLNSNKLTSVKGLEKLTQLRYLNLRSNPDLTKAQINELQKALPKCKIYSNPPLTKEESAKVIEAAIREAAKKPTGKLTKADYEKVMTLDFFSQQLTDVKGLEKLTQLTFLNLGQNQLTNVKGLEKLTQLTFLNLGDNQLTNVKGLEKLTQLKTLYLHINQLTSVKGLEKLTNLTVLDIRYNYYLTKAQIDELKKSLPKCDIYSNPTK